MALTSDDLAALPDAAKAKYNILEAGFASDFWHLIKVWAMQNADEATARVLASTKWEDHCLHTGARLAFADMANQETINENEFRVAADEAKEAAATANDLDAEEISE